MKKIQIYMFDRNRVDNLIQELKKNFSGVGVDWQKVSNPSPLFSFWPNPKSFGAKAPCNKEESNAVVIKIKNRDAIFIAGKGPAGRAFVYNENFSPEEANKIFSAAFNTVSKSSSLADSKFWYYLYFVLMPIFTILSLLLTLVGGSGIIIFIVFVYPEIKIFLGARKILRIRKIKPI